MPWLGIEPRPLDSKADTRQHHYKSRLVQQGHKSVDKLPLLHKYSKILNVRHHYFKNNVQRCWSNYRPRQYFQLFLLTGLHANNHHKIFNGLEGYLSQ